jgi:hypothetical protein
MFDNWGGPLFFVRRIFKNPLSLFIYGLLSKWYVIIITGSLIVTFWVFTGLKKAGVIDAVNKILVTSIEETKGIAQNCIPQITDLQKFWNCLNNPASTRYVPTENDSKLQSDIEKDLNRVPNIPNAQEDH